MTPEFKPDWDECRPRIDAWWRGEILDRVPVMATAPMPDDTPPGPKPRDLEASWIDPDWVVPNLERWSRARYWGGEAVPALFPVSTKMPAILAAYLGCPLTFVGQTTAWAAPIFESWDDPPPLEFDTENEWWRRSARLLETAAARAPGRYFVGLPDLNGPGEAVARLRGSERLCFDVIERPRQVKDAIDKVTRAWHDCFRECLRIVNRHVPGSISWMGIWSDEPAVDLQCDFSIMISPGMFRDIFLPSLRQQTELVGRTIYHLDGPGAVRHLDALLSLPRLSGIQWVPGAGAAPMGEWIELLRKVLESGKLLYIECELHEVEPLMRRLPHPGLLLRVRCNSRPETDELLANVARWTC